jgi:hypothetical protein
MTTYEKSHNSCCFVGTKITSWKFCNSMEKQILGVNRNFLKFRIKMTSPCFGIMGGNFAFNLIVKLSVELGYV